jgi:titin
VFNPASGTTTYNNSGLTAGTRYYYRIRAENNRDHSPYTSEISRITIPSTPNLVSPSQVTDSTFRLNIPTVTGASEFHFDVSTDNSFSTFLYQGLVSSTNFINITGLTPATTYYFRYRPVNESGFGANSSVFNATTNSPPLALTASETGQNTFKAHWTPVASASNYRIDLSTDNFITFVQLNQYTIDTFYVFTSLPHSTTYQYRVRTINLNGNPSVNSNIINVTTSAPPIVPPVLSLYNYADRIQLSWFGGNYYNKVDIERSDGNNSNYITIASNLSGSYFDDILTQSGTYYYRLKVFNPLNEYSYSNEESSSFTLVGITDKINNSFTIYPNPSEGILFIEFKNNNYDYELRIINSLGKVVWNQRINSKYSGSTNEQNLTQLENGIYYVEIFEIGSNKSSRTLFVKH